MTTLHWSNAYNKTDTKHSEAAVYYKIVASFSG